MATFTYLTPDPAPFRQVGICTEYPAGYAGTPVHWIGPLSQLVAEGGETKVPQGFKARQLVVKAEPMVPHVFLDGVEAEKFLDDGDSVTVTVAGSAFTAGGNAAVTKAAPVATASVTGKVVPAEEADGSDSDSDADEAGVVTITAAGTLTGDAMVEVLVYCDLVDPHPPQMF
jgi:hypothetical protein